MSLCIAESSRIQKQVLLDAPSLRHYPESPVHFRNRDPPLTLTSTAWNERYGGRNSKTLFQQVEMNLGELASNGAVSEKIPNVDNGEIGQKTVTRVQTKCIEVRTDA